VVGRPDVGPDGPIDASALAFVRHCSVFKEPDSGRDGPREGIRLHPGRYSSPGWAWGVRTARFRFRRVRRLLERD